MTTLPYRNNMPDPPPLDRIFTPKTIEILERVSLLLSISIADIQSTNRKRRNFIARSIAAYAIRRSCRLTYDEIGQLLGGRDHTTALNAVQHVEAKLKTDLWTRDAVAWVERGLNQRVRGAFQ